MEKNDFIKLFNVKVLILFNPSLKPCNRKSLMQIFPNFLVKIEEKSIIREKKGLNDWQKKGVSDWQKSLKATSFLTGIFFKQPISKNSVIR